MQSRLMGHLRDVERIVKENPALQNMQAAGLVPEMTSSPPGHFQDRAVQIGCEFLELSRKTVQVLEENKHDVTKIRRRIEDHLRKYASEEDIIRLALYLGVPVK